MFLVMSDSAKVRLLDRNGEKGPCDAYSPPLTPLDRTPAFGVGDREGRNAADRNKPRVNDPLNNLTPFALFNQTVRDPGTLVPGCTYGKPHRREAWW